MNDHALLAEAHKLLHATPTASALDALVHHAAQGWCSSFGVRNEAAYDRLASATLKNMTAPNAGRPLQDIHHFIDHHAEVAIVEWFAHIQPHLLSAEPQPLSLLRYSFLEANHAGAFSDVFLHPNAPFEEIGAAMAAHDVAPTPAFTRREMPRQEI